MLKVIVKLICVLWSAPNSLLGLFVGGLGVLTGGRARFRQGCLEFFGGATTFFLSRTPIKASAMTLGHTILGQTSELLDSARDHEHIHVRQYERWGPFFLPAYGLSSLYLRIRGREAYYNNPFEKEAYNKTDIDHRCDHHDHKQ